MRQRRVTRVEGTRQIRFDHIGPLIRRHRCDVGEHADTGVVDQDVQSAEPRNRGGNRAFDSVVRSNVGLQRLDGTGSGRFDRGRGRGQLSSTPARDGDMHALGDEGAGNRQSDAARSAGDDRDLAGQLFHTL